MPALGPESPSSKNVKGIISLVKGRGTEICFAGKSEMLSVFTGHHEAEIFLMQPREKMIFFWLLLNNNQKKKIGSFHLFTIYHSHILFPNPPPQRGL